jgi:hypothetical protein
MPNGRDTDPAVERWAGAGHSDDPDSARAGREAVAAAIAGEDPRLVVVFASPRHSLEALADAAHEAAGPARLIGCSGAGGIAPQPAGAGGVNALALGGRGFSVATASESLTGVDSRTAGVKAASCLAHLDQELPHRALIVLTDGLGADPDAVVRGAYSVAGAVVTLVGGRAGQELRTGQTGQLHGGQVVSGSVVAAAIASQAPLGVGVRHGWTTLGDPLLVTASDGNELRTLNDRPALDMYLDVLGAPVKARWDAAAFMRFALLHPFGVAGARGREAQIRTVAAADFKSRSLKCVAELPAGTLVWVMEGEREQVLDATNQACEDALAPLRGKPPLGLLAFDAVARAAVLGRDGVREERARLTAVAGGAPLASLRTYGEIARIRGFSGFHSHALAVLAIG